MVKLIDCPSCQWGHHDRHITDWDTKPDGVLDGSCCVCNGDCEERNKGMLDRLMRAIFPIEDDSE